MTLLEQWQEQKRQIEAAIAKGRIDPEEGAGELAHLTYRINRRPLILKRRKDRKAWREAQAAKHLAAYLIRSDSRARSAD